MLIPDHGITPIRRKMDRRTQGADFEFESASVEFGFELELEPPSRASLVIARARGKALLRNGANGAANKVAKIDPIVVNRVRRRVAYAGENNAPARTFYIKQSETMKGEYVIDLSAYPDDAPRY